MLLINQGFYCQKIDAITKRDRRQSSLGLKVGEVKSPERWTSPRMLTYSYKTWLLD